MITGYLYFFCSTETRLLSLFVTAAGRRISTACVVVLDIVPIQTMGCTDGIRWMDGWMDVWMDGWMDLFVCLSHINVPVLAHAGHIGTDRSLLTGHDALLL